MEKQIVNALAACQATTEWAVKALQQEPDRVLAAATPLLGLMGSTISTTLLAAGAAAEMSKADPSIQARKHWQWAGFLADTVLESVPNTAAALRTAANLPDATFFD